MADFLTQGPTDLRVAPLAHLAGDLAAAEVAGPRGVRLVEIPFTTKIGLRAVPGSDAHAALAEAIGVGLPDAVGETTGTADGVAVLWLAPDEFLAVAPPDRHDLLAGLLSALGEFPGQVVDLSANRTMLEISGPSAAEVLAKGIPVDLHPRVLGPGRAITAMLGPVPVLLWCVAAATYRVLPRASFAEYTARWLLDAMREYAAAPAAPAHG